MDIWTLFFRIDLVLAMIVLTFYALRELQDFWYNFVQHRIEKATLKTEATFEAVYSKITGAGKSAVDGVTDAVDGARNKLADGMQAATDEVRPDEDA